MSNPTVILNGDQIYLEELVRENARLTVQIEAERQRRYELETTLDQMKQENETLSERVGQLEEDLNLAAESSARGKVLAANLDQAVRDLHFVMAGGDACTVCKNKCLMGAGACKPRWKGLDE